MKDFSGIVTMFGKRFSFVEKDGGYGLIQIDGQWVIVKFACLVEFDPPSINVELVAHTTSEIVLVDGQLTYKGYILQVGVEKLG